MGFFPQMIVLRQDYMPNRDKPIQIDNAKEMQVGITIRANKVHEMVRVSRIQSINERLSQRWDQGQSSKLPWWMTAYWVTDGANSMFLVVEIALTCLHLFSSWSETIRSEWPGRFCEVLFICGFWIFIWLVGFILVWFGFGFGVLVWWWVLVIWGEIQCQIILSKRKK